MGLRCGDQEVIPVVNYRCISSYAVVRFLKVRCQSNFAQVGNECMDTRFCVCVCARACVRANMMGFHCIHDSETSIISLCVISSQVSFMSCIPEKSFL